MGKSERPEHTAPPDIFYNEDEARKYTTNTRMIAIQEKLTHVSAHTCVHMLLHLHHLVD